MEGLGRGGIPWSLHPFPAFPLTEPQHYFLQSQDLS
jgi:hypothetical protein